MEDFQIGSISVAPGTRAQLDMPVALLPTHTQLHLPLTILHGREPGPAIWVNAAIHGDELNGVDVIRRVLGDLSEPLLRGTLIAAPIVNVFGFVQQSRYLPDRRDLNRCFPGTTRGSLAGRIAELFVREIVSKCTFGIDLHTAAIGNSNFPQVRGDLGDPAVLELARAFGAPIMLDAKVRPGSLRAAARKVGAKVIVFEGGEALRFNEDAIDIGHRGVLAVLASLGMIAPELARPVAESEFSATSSWVRARLGGLFRLAVDEGDHVKRKQILGTISDPFGNDEHKVKAPFTGRIVGLSRNPIVHGGDAIVHVGRIEDDLSALA